MILVIQCRDHIGLVASISGALASLDFNIITLQEYADSQENLFFIRLEVQGGNADAESLKSLLESVIPKPFTIRVNPKPNKKIMVLVTKDYHCLSDLLIRNYFGSLGGNVVAVLGNYPDLRDICLRFDIPFYWVSHQNISKEEFESRLEEHIQDYNPDYIVLAKFMRILSPSITEKYPLKIINIHHSFLPAFVGASPYKQAYERGVKIIGATAHFVTNDLDEGPIITQQTIPVNHSLSAKDMVRAGREIETSVLTRALQLVLEDRVFVYKNRTVVFE
jgi:formyltetrahydrofolate deformylase